MTVYPNEKGKSQSLEDILDFQLEEFEQEENESQIDSSKHSSEELGVPEDPIEDLEWFPSFVDDSLCLDDVKKRNKEEENDFYRMGSSRQVPGKARSKRSGGRVWSLTIPLPLGTQHLSIKEQEKKVEPQRRCTHCQVEKTPQWRNGPNGPKTLCNACGVRYMSGRLVPEYRPAASPTFVNHMHSNSHKKILMMRKQRLEEPC